MANIANRYPSNLKGSELGGEIEVTIERVDELPDVYNRTVIHFDDETILAANSQQARKIASILGTWETWEWQGRTIILYPEPIKIRDRDTGELKDVVSIKIKPSPNDDKQRAEAIRAAAPQRPRSMKDELDDDKIPF